LNYPKTKKLKINFLKEFYSSAFHAACYNEFGEIVNLSEKPFPCSNKSASTGAYNCDVVKKKF